MPPGSWSTNPVLDGHDQRRQDRSPHACANGRQASRSLPVSGAIEYIASIAVQKTCAVFGLRSLPLLHLTLTADAPSLRCAGRPTAYMCPSSSAGDDPSRRRCPSCCPTRRRGGGKLSHRDKKAADTARCLTVRSLTTGTPRTRATENRGIVRNRLDDRADVAIWHRQGSKLASDKSNGPNLLRDWTWTTRVDSAGCPTTFDCLTNCSRLMAAHSSAHRAGDRRWCRCRRISLALAANRSRRMRLTGGRLALGSPVGPIVSFGYNARPSVEKTAALHLDLLQGRSTPASAMARTGLTSRTISVHGASIRRLIVGRYPDAHCCRRAGAGDDCTLCR